MKIYISIQNGFGVTGLQTIVMGKTKRDVSWNTYIDLGVLESEFRVTSEQFDFELEPYHVYQKFDNRWVNRTFEKQKYYWLYENTGAARELNVLKLLENIRGKSKETLLSVGVNEYEVLHPVRHDWMKLPVIHLYRNNGISRLRVGELVYHHDEGGGPQVKITDELYIDHFESVSEGIKPMPEALQPECDDLTIEEVEWVVVDDYCAAVVVVGQSYSRQTCKAFIEKSPRVRIRNDNWLYGPKGSGCSHGEAKKNEAYGFDKDSRAWCEKVLNFIGEVRFKNKPCHE